MPRRRSRSRRARPTRGRIVRRRRSSSGRCSTILRRPPQLDDFAGDVVFDMLTPDNHPRKRRNLEAAIRSCAADSTPLPGEPRPIDARIASFVTWLETALDRAALRPRIRLADHYIGRTVWQYVNGVRDLLDLEVDATDEAYWPTIRAAASTTSPTRSPSPPLCLPPTSPRRAR